MYIIYKCQNNLSKKWPDDKRDSQGMYINPDKNKTERSLKSQNLLNIMYLSK
jgi:hypothetical protein